MGASDYHQAFGNAADSPADPSAEQSRVYAHKVEGLFLNPYTKTLPFILREHPDCYSIECPGGGVEEGESAQDALIREMLQECGVAQISYSPQHLGQIEDYIESKNRWRLTDYFCCRSVGIHYNSAKTEDRHLAVLIGFVRLPHGADAVSESYDALKEQLLSGATKVIESQKGSLDKSIEFRLPFAIYAKFLQPFSGGMSVEAH